MSKTFREVIRLVIWLPVISIPLLAASSSNETWVSFRLPESGTIGFKLSAPQAPSSADKWVSGQRDDGSAPDLEFGSRVVLQTREGIPWNNLVKGRPLELSSVVGSNLFIFQAPDAWTAAQEAGRLAARPGVQAAYPVMRRAAALNGAYARRPNDPHFPPLLGNTIGQWYMENRDENTGASLGMDLNVRGAWPLSRGEGVTLAVADVGVELSHPELASRTAGAPHRNFNNNSTNGNPLGVSAAWAHGTACAGLLVAEGDNQYGMVGVAPAAHLASWLIFTNRPSGLVLVNDEKLMEMYQYQTDTVGVQNHSWALPGVLQQGRTPLEDAGIENAIRNGRDGRGVVMVRSAGNDRGLTANANDSGYSADPRVITVGAVARNGRVPLYSELGACVLLGAPSGEAGGSGLFSTDLTEARGTLFISFFPPFEYLWNFVFNSYGFSGTSASTPLVAGIAALILSINPELTYRDVQQILLLSARHYDFADPDLRSNGAGFLVSHNDGFGVPDAGQAAKLARHWTNRPPLLSVTTEGGPPFAVPDDGLRVVVTGNGVPSSLASIRCLPTSSPHADTPTASLPLVDLGLATEPIQIDLRGKAALIQRGMNNYDEKIYRAAQAGAEFVVLYNYATNTTGGGCPGGDQLCLVGGADFMPIPAVFVKHSDGVALRNLIETNSGARAQVRLLHADTVFTFTEMLLCEHVGVRVQADHPLRGDLRITLVSPSGTRSVLQQYNADITSGPHDWTYYSTHHFYESSRGNWRVEFSDQGRDAQGSILSVELTILGVPIDDSDADGLDDNWEFLRLGSLAYGPQDDPDGDGYSNAREQIMQTDPLATNEPLRLDLSLWNSRLARLSWPGVTSRCYEVWGGPDPAALTLITTLPGRFPEMEWFAPYSGATQQFFRIRDVDP